ncbi:MAG: ABC transporter transmembrane domain-containing protein, partial [archaeon]
MSENKETTNEKILFKDKVQAIFLAIKWSYRSSKILFISQIILAIVSGLLLIIEPFTYKILLDNLTSLDIATNQKIGITIVLIIVAYTVLRFLNSILNELTFLLQVAHNYRLNRDVSHELMDKVATLDLSYFDDATFHDDLSKANRSMWRVPDVFKDSVRLLKAVVGLISILISIIIFDWRICLLAIIGTIPSVFASLQFANLNWSAFSSTSKVNRKAWYYLDLLGSNNSSVKEIKIFSLKDTFLRKWNLLFKEVIIEQDKAIRKQAIAIILSRMFAITFISL